MWIALSSTLCLIISVSGGIYSGLDGDKQGNLFIGSNDFGGKGEDLGVKTILIAVPVVSGGLVSDSGRKGSYFSGVGSLNGGGKGFTGEFAGNLGKEGFGGGFGGSQENRGLGGGFTGNQIKVGFGDGFLGNLGKGNFDGGFRGKFDDTIGFGKKGFNHGFDGGVGKVGFNSGFGTRSFGKGGIDKEDFIGRNTEIARKGGLGSSIENSKGRLIANYGRGSYNSGGYENIGEGNKGDFTLGGPRSVSFFRKGFRNELKADVEKRGSQGGFGEEECDFPETTEGDLGKDESGTGRRGFAKIGFLGGAQKFNKDNGKGTSIRNGRDSDDFQRLVQNGFGEGGHDGRLNGFVLANGKDVFSKVSNERNNGKALYGEIGGKLKACITRRISDRFFLLNYSIKYI